VGGCHSRSLTPSTPLTEQCHLMRSRASTSALGCHVIETYDSPTRFACGRDVCRQRDVPAGKSVVDGTSIAGDGCGVEDEVDFVPLLPTGPPDPFVSRYGAQTDSASSGADCSVGVRRSYRCLGNEAGASFDAVDCRRVSGCLGRGQVEAVEDLGWLLLEAQ
jgi:hypothetical protein